MKGHALSFTCFPSHLLCALVILTGGFPPTPAWAQGDAIPSPASIVEIQSTRDAKGDSQWKGLLVTVSGIVTGLNPQGYTIAETPGPWGGITVSDTFHAPEVGDRVLVQGRVFESFGMTVLVNVAAFQPLSSGHPVEATRVSVADVGQEAYESVLITLEEVVVAALLPFGEWAVTDGSGNHALCDDLVDYAYFPRMGDRLESVSGIVFYSFGAFKLEPRATYDISGEGIPHYALRGDVVTLNDTREFLRNVQVEVLGDRIMGITRGRPGNLPVIRVPGLIFPGLVDSHNHPSYNVLGRLHFGRLFNDRSEWQATPLNDDFGEQYRNILHSGGEWAQEANMYKLAEIRALTAGTTAIQGVNCNQDWAATFAHQGMGINNVERFPARVYHDTFPLENGPDFWRGIRRYALDRFIIHLCEGTSEAALAEFYQWKDDYGMLDYRTTLIHGVPLGPAEWAALGEAGASLVWSPASNLRLYGHTADIPGALAAGVNVALAPDWTETGSEHLLAELKVAQAVNRVWWGGRLTPLQLTEFVTRNAARAVGSEERMGQVVPGFRANLMVIAGNPASPYTSLLAATPEDVHLTIVDGYPRYGDPELLARFEVVENPETITIGRGRKALSIRVDAHGIPESGKPFSQILAELREAYDGAEPKVCEFLGLE